MPWVPGSDPERLARALERLVPAMRALVPDAVIRLVGTPIPRELVRRALAVGVEVPGCLENPREALAAARAALVLEPEPLADTVLDAQAAGVPVVAPAAVLAALPDPGGAQEADDASGQASALATLLSDDAAWRTAGHAARAAASLYDPAQGHEELGELLAYLELLP